MFEHIHLLSGPEEVYMKEDTADPLYRTFQRENQDVLPSDARFQIAGKVRYLLERPHEPGGSGVSFLSADLFSYGDGRRLLYQEKGFCLLSAAVHL